MQIHLLWIGPQPLTFLDHVAVLTIRSTCNIKPTFWLSGVPENEWSERICEHCDLPDLGKLPDRMLEIANSISHPRHRSDYLRMCLVHEFGGSYCDTDIFWIKSIFDGSFSLDGMVVAEHGSGAEVGNAFLYTKDPGNGILSEMIQLAEHLAMTTNLVETKHSPLGLDVVNAVIKKTESSVTKLPRETFFRYYYPDWEKSVISPGDGEIKDDVYGLHWWRFLFVEKMNRLVTPGYIKTSDRLLAKYLRKGLENGNWIDAL